MYQCDTYYENGAIMPQTLPTAEEILTALADDPRFSADSESFDLLKDYIVLLPEVIGDERLAQLVTLDELCNVYMQFLDRILAEGFGTNFDDLGLVRELYGSLARGLEGIVGNTEQVLTQTGQTEDEAILSEQVGLYEPAKEVYRNGQLTFSELVRLQPGVFVPQST